MAPGILRLAYRARYHRLGRWGLDQWLAILALGGALLVALRRLGALLVGDPGVWLEVVALAGVGCAVLLLGQRAARQNYLRFAAEPDLTPPPPEPMLPADKLLLHATGCFTVEGKLHFFADLPAYWRSFATREHALMAIVHPARFLLLGSVPAQDIGMWYIFFRPEMVRAVSPGRMTFGGQDQPALRVEYEDSELPQPNKLLAQLLRQRQRQQRRQLPLEAVYLGFDAEEERRRVWADLLAGNQSG